MPPQRFRWVAVAPVAVLLACASTPTAQPVPVPQDDATLKTLTAVDGVPLVYAEMVPSTPPRALLLYVSGVTGFNHHLMQQQTHALNEAGVGVLYLYPRGTGYSGGTRGHLANLDAFLDDHRRVLERALQSHPDVAVFVMGASMGAALAVKLAADLGTTSGVILVNPAYRLKELKGASPSPADYVKYAAYYLFRRSTPVVDMSGDPDLIPNPQDQEETRQRKNDPLVQALHSLQTMTLARGVMDELPANAARCQAPLLLLHGLQDPLVDPSGHHVILGAWKGTDKQKVDVPNGGHGYSTVVEGLPQLTRWMLLHLPR